MPKMWPAKTGLRMWRNCEKWTKDPDNDCEKKVRKTGNLGIGNGKRNRYQEDGKGTQGRTWLRWNSEGQCDWTSGRSHKKDKTAAG